MRLMLYACSNVMRWECTHHNWSELLKRTQRESFLLSSSKTNKKQQQQQFHFSFHLYLCEIFIRICCEHLGRSFRVEEQHVDFLQIGFAHRGTSVHSSVDIRRSKKLNRISRPREKRLGFFFFCNESSSFVSFFPSCYFLIDFYLKKILLSFFSIFKLLFTP